MLPASLRIAILIGIVVYFFILIMLLRQKRLNLKYTLLWLFSGLLMLILSVFPQLLSGITSLLGIQLQSNALFAILFFCGMIILMSLTSIISKQNESIKQLVQYTALLEKRVREVENHQGMT